MRRYRWLLDDYWFMPARQHHEPWETVINQLHQGVVRDYYNGPTAEIKCRTKRIDRQAGRVKSPKKIEPKETDVGDE